MTIDVKAKLENHPLLLAAKHDFVEIAEAAAMLGVSLRTARRRQAAGLMPRRKKFVRTWKYARSDILKLRDGAA